MRIDEYLLPGSQEVINNWRTDDLVPYCGNMCKTKSCCTQSSLNGLTKKELHAVMGTKNSGDIRKLERMDIIESDGSILNKRYRLKIICPKYNTQTGKCDIYEDPEKPETCKINPLQVFHNPDPVDTETYRICLNNRCELVQKNEEDIINFFNSKLKEDPLFDGFI